METTSGFYKFEDDSWQYAPNFISAPDYTLEKELKYTYTYPIDGWNWYDEQPENFLIKTENQPILDIEP
jgi:hypothetical protein